VLLLISPTRPTWTPRSFTLAPGSITRPALSDFSVTVSYDLNVPANSTLVPPTIKPITANRISVHHPGARPLSLLDSIALPRQVEAAGLAVDGQ
jgi:hypothetical protein